MSGKPDSSLAESVRAGEQIARSLQEIDGVLSVAQQIGRADLSEDTWGPNVSEVWFATDDQADYDRVLREIRERLEAVPGYVFQVKQFLSASKMLPTSSIGKQPVGGFISHATPKDATLPGWFEIFNGR